MTWGTRGFFQCRDCDADALLRQRWPQPRAINRDRRRTSPNTNGPLSSPSNTPSRNPKPRVGGSSRSGATTIPNKISCLNHGSA